MWPNCKADWKSCFACSDDDDVARQKTKVERCRPYYYGDPIRGRKVRLPIVAYLLKWIK